MEIERSHFWELPNFSNSCWSICLAIALSFNLAFAQQPIKHFLVKDGKMIIELSRNISPFSLDSFIVQYRLQNLGLKGFVEKNNTDSLKKSGWKIEKNNRELCVASLRFSGLSQLDNPSEKLSYSVKSSKNYTSLFPAVSNNVLFGINRFRNKYPFTVRDSTVIFFLKNHLKANQVMLAGSFNNWNPNILPMLPKDSGWVAYVKLSPGKYWYKFVIDGNWNTDEDNLQTENDNRGNNNSVYYKTNIIFSLNGYSSAKKVFVAGSFNHWDPHQLPMSKTYSGWQLPIYLANGTHTYRYIADENWFADPVNKNKAPNEFNDYNSVIKLGSSQMFVLNGHTNAKEVMLIGSFNGWRRNELYLYKTSTGWELPYALGDGNYEYRFVVDNKEIYDEENGLTIIGEDGKKNGYKVVSPNYTYRLKGYGQAKTVAVTGDFNNWNKHGIPMKKNGNDWIFDVHLSLGKHLYKFIVDGEWIKDPSNKLWEQNEYRTGNSIIWVEQQ